MVNALERASRLCAKPLGARCLLLQTGVVALRPFMGGEPRRAVALNSCTGSMQVDAGALHEEGESPV